MSDDDRAARAFADAFARHAEADFAPLDPEALAALAVAVSTRPAAPPAPSAIPAPVPLAPRRERRRSRWLPLAAAAALAITAGTVALSLNSGTPTAFAPPRPASDRGAPVEGGGQPVGGQEGGGQEVGTADSGTLAPPAPGWRYESFLDVVVAVPADWGYAAAPGVDWCAGGSPASVPEAPFVDLNPRGRPVRAIACPSGVPADRLQTHLTYRRAAPGDAAATASDAGWTTVSDVVGSAYVSVVAPADDVELARTILAGARPVTADQNGCAPEAPEARPAGAAAGLPAAADALVLCQYAGLDQPGPHLVASAALGADDARRVLDAVRSRPTVVPADAVEPDCAAAPTASTDLLVVRFGSAGGVREVQLAFNGCRPFVLDDGVTTRAPDGATAGALLARRPLAVWASWGRQADAVLHGT